MSTSDKRYRELVEKSLAGVFVYRGDRILYANRRLAEMLGHDPEDIAGRNFWGLFRKDDRPAVRERLARRAAGQVSDLHYEARFVRADGSVFWAEVASSPTEFEGVPSVLVNVYDISARKQAEEKEQELSSLMKVQEEQLVHSSRLAELGEMAASVAHELNQPLTGIRNFARNAIYMLENDAGSQEDVLENLHLVTEQVDRAARIIGQMRGLARKTDLKKEQVDVAAILNETVEFLGAEFRKAGIAVAMQIERKIPQVLGDRVRLEQVFLNVLTNAVHAMETAEDKRLSVRVAATGQREVTVEISDTGVGFTEQEKAKIFQPFYSKRESGHGTGLGLPVSLNLVRGHGGKLEAEGEPGKGALFRITLPAMETKDDA